jgi:hypothetical protein
MVLYIMPQHTEGMLRLHKSVSLWIPASILFLLYGMIILPRLLLSKRSLHHVAMKTGCLIALAMSFGCFMALLHAQHRSLPELGLMSGSLQCKGCMVLGMVLFRPCQPNPLPADATINPLPAVANQIPSC